MWQNIKDTIKATYKVSKAKTYFLAPRYVQGKLFTSAVCQYLHSIPLNPYENAFKDNIWRLKPCIFVV